MPDLTGLVINNLRVIDPTLTPIAGQKHTRYNCVCVACGTKTTKWDAVLLDKRHPVKCAHCGDRRPTSEYWHFQTLDRVYTVQEHLFEDAIKNLPPGYYSVWATVEGQDYAQRLPHKDFTK